MMSQFSRKPSQRKITILEALDEHPLLSRRQLELYLNCTERRAQKHLAELVHRGWVRHYNAKQPGLYTRSLFAITESGIEVLKQQGTDLSVCSSQRTARLALMMERVFKIRNLMLWLANAKLWNWRPSRWNCEVAVELAIREQTTTVPFHAAALFTRTDKKWTWAVIEFDTRRASIESQRERLRALVIAQEDHTPRAIEFPVLIILAADALRLQDYYTILHTTALTGQKPMPHAYLAVASDAIKLREDATAPIWYSTVSGRRTSLLFDASGNAIPLPSQTPWYTLPMSRQGTREPRIVEIKPLGKSELPVPGVLGLGSLALALEPIDKQLLDEVARHPLLTSKELATVLQSTLWYVETHLRKLGIWKLLEAYALSDKEPPMLIQFDTDLSTNTLKKQKIHFVLASLGIRYLTAVAGFDGRISRYAKSRGWGRGLDVLLKYYKHTQQENAVFLQFARIAQRHKHTLAWLSELESRLYYEHNDRRHSFLPDGRGTYIAWNRRYEFAIEIDRSRASRKKLRRKLAEYMACLTANILRNERIEMLNVLVVTNSWERAKTIHQTTLALARELKTVDTLPLYITTFDRLQASGADAPIWMAVRPDSPSRLGTSVPKTYCFDCFKPTS